MRVELKPLKLEKKESVSSRNVGTRKTTIYVLIIAMLIDDIHYMASTVAATALDPLLDKENYLIIMRLLKGWANSAGKNLTDSADNGSRQERNGAAATWLGSTWKHYVSAAVWNRVVDIFDMVRAMYREDQAKNLVGVTYWWDSEQGKIIREFSPEEVADFPYRAEEPKQNIPEPTPIPEAGPSEPSPIPAVTELGRSEPSAMPEPGRNEPKLPELAQSEDTGQAGSRRTTRRPRIPIPVWVLFGALVLGILLKNPEPNSQMIYPVESWRARSNTQNRKSLETEQNPMQRLNIARGMVGNTNADRPFLLDETRVMVACDNGRKFVLMPEYAIELGDWVVIKQGKETFRGGLIDLTIREATLLTLSGKEETVPLPYPEKFIHTSWDMRDIEVLPMTGGNLRRIIEGWCAIRGGFDYGPLDEFANTAVIGQFDDFDELLFLSADKVGLELREGHISPSFASIRWYIRWERDFWSQESLGSAAERMSILTGLEFEVSISDAQLIFGWGSASLKQSLERHGLEAISEGLRIIWRRK